jgi:SAM-dependent methyltransferase
MHSNSKLLFEKYVKQIFKSHMKVLEIGPDDHPSAFRKIVDDETIQWDTIDIFNSDKLTYIAEDEYNFPIPDNTYDIVLSAQVLEHVRKVWIWIKEVSRVCKTGGYVVTINPVSWPYHEAPIDCWRVYPEGMKALYDEAGLVCKLSSTESLEVDVINSVTPLDYKDITKNYDTYPKKLLKILLGRSVLVPGTSYHSNYKVFLQQFLGRPRQFSIDTITIGIKESVAE